MAQNSIQNPLQMLSTGQVAKLLSTSPDTVRNLVRGGQLFARKIGTGNARRWRFMQVDIADFIERSTPVGGQVN